MASVLSIIEIAVASVLKIFEAKVKAEESKERIRAWRMLQAQAAHRAAQEEAELAYAQAKRRRRAP